LSRVREVQRNVFDLNEHEGYCTVDAMVAKAREEVAVEMYVCVEKEWNRLGSGVRSG